MYEDLIYDVDDPVATITLNRPNALNAFTMGTLRELRAAIEAAVADRRAVGIVVTGSGKGFCAGLDASALGASVEAGSAGQQRQKSGQLPGLFSYMPAVPKPIVAAINGVTAGGGFVMACLADIRIASTDASFTTVFTKRGLIAEHGSSWILPRLIGTGAALDLLWSSRKVGADEALRIGLVQQVVEPDDLLSAARAYIEMLATNASPAAIADTKALVYNHLGTDFETALHEADAAMASALDRRDAGEGVRSFLERRPPEFDRLGEP